MDIRDTESYSFERFIELYKLKCKTNPYVLDKEKLITTNCFSELSNTDIFDDNIIDLEIDDEYADSDNDWTTDLDRYLNDWVKLLTANKSVVCFCYGEKCLSARYIRILLDEDGMFVLKDLLGVSQFKTYRDQEAYKILYFLAGLKGNGIDPLYKHFYKSKKHILTQEEKQKIISIVNNFDEGSWHMKYRTRLLLPVGYFLRKDVMSLMSEEISDVFQVKKEYYAYRPKYEGE